MKLTFVTQFVMASALGLAGASAQAGVVTLNSTQTGFYQNSGGTNNSPILIEDSTRNNYFAFDLSSVSGTVTAAVLTIFGGNGNYSTGLKSVTYTVYDVSTPLTALLGGSGGSAAFTDLGSGTAYGSTTVSTPSNFAAMPEVVVDLAGGIPDINAALGGLFAVGGNSSLTGNGGFLWISSSRTPAASLTLTTADAVAPVPLPASLPLLAAALAGVAVLRRRA